MNRYTIAYSVYFVVYAEDRWEAFERASEEIDKGGWEFSDPYVVDSEHIPTTSTAKRVATPRGALWRR